MILLADTTKYQGYKEKQAQMCAEGCEGDFLFSLISIREKIFSTKELLV